MFGSIKKYIGNFYTKATSRDEKMRVDDFKFHDAFEEDSNNGLILNDHYIPEEILIKILSFVPPKELLTLALVCKKWCNIIKSEMLWIDIYKRENPHPTKWLPWYVYYVYCTTNAFKNMLQNGNGNDQYRHWKIMRNFGDQFVIEKEPQGSEPLPSNVPDFNGHKSCFATSYYECTKLQEIKLEDRRLLRYIMNKHKPHLYASEWVAARFDCGSKYVLQFKGLSQELKQIAKDGDDDDIDYDSAVLFQDERQIFMPQWGNATWSKVEIVIDDYPDNVMSLIFLHEGRDTQYWKGHYGSKMAGGVVKLLFDTIKTEDLS
ncbi:F-box only protein 6-like [Diorhabda carinulata]|uniref:F-box only protein 6-like n=1 Tax=Diorhabda carinulata TaxID=1163345 RepID=UPI0025A28184|nr:F-box only protein 6-like [Diorhabda carinulata]